MSKIVEYKIKISVVFRLDFEKFPVIFKISIYLKNCFDENRLLQLAISHFFASVLPRYVCIVMSFVCPCISVVLYGCS